MQDRAPPLRDCRLADIPLSADAVEALLETLIRRRPGPVLDCARRDPILAAHLVAWSTANGLARRAYGLRKLATKLSGPMLVDFVDATLSGIPHGNGAPPPNRAAPAHIVFDSLRRYSSRLATMASNEAARSEASDPDAVYLAGILESLGMFALARRYPGSYGEVLIESASRTDLRRRERARFGTDHRSIRRQIAPAWGLPDWVTAPVGSLPGGAHVARAVSLCWPIVDSCQATSPSRAPTDASDTDAGYRVTLETAAALVRLVSDHECLQTERRDEVEREKLESLAEFAAGAGHEINNPLAVIYGRAQLLLAGETDPERRRALLTMATQAMRIHEMIADVMLFARPPEPQRQRIELGPLVTDALRALSSQAAERGIALRFQPPPTPVDAWADAVQIRVVLVSLLTNCIEALNRGGSVEVALAIRKRRRRTTVSSASSNGGNGTASRNRDDGSLSSPPSCSEADLTPDSLEARSCSEFAVLRVVDDGPGMSDEVRRHLFDPFYSGRQAGRGLGLGLAKCWRITKAHGGTIQVKSRPGRGTAFTVLLPSMPPVDGTPSL